MLDAFTAPHLLSGLPPGTPILAALSGGADSVALLAMLREYADEHGTPLRAAHVNHGIRGEEAIRDRDFCVDLAARWGIPISVLDADVPSLRQARGGSMEEVARQVRYEFFERVMEEYHFPLLATAHHADDQLETMLLRLTRGTGPDGLCGIPPRRSLGQGRWVIRPLLGCRKAALEDYCRERRLDFVVDSSNDDISYARNRIRREVIPHLRAINPAVTDAAARLAESLRADTATLAGRAGAFWQASVCCESTAEGYTRVSVPCEALRSMEESVCRRVLVMMMTQAGCPQAEGCFVRRLAEMAASGREGMRISLPGSVSARLVSGRLALCYEAREKTGGHDALSVPEAVEIDLSALPQTVVFGDFGLTFSEEPPEEGADGTKKFQFCEIVYKMSMNAALNSDTIKRRLFLRTRRAGDLFVSRGHHRKVKKLFCDHGVPQALRDRFPLICDEEGIVCIPGIGVRDGSHPIEGGRTLYIRVRCLATHDDPSVDPEGLTDRI